MYYGWVVVAGAFLAQCFITGFYTYGFPLIVVPVEAEFAASRTEVMYGVTFAALFGLLLAPLIGLLADRWSVRALMSIGAAVFAVGLMALSVSTSLWQFTLCFAVLMALANNLLGPLTSTTVVARWFSSKRGRALGLTAAGTSLGGMLVPFCLAQGLLFYGWRDSLFYFGLAMALFLLPFLLLLIRNKPADMGLTVEGQEEAATAAVEGSELAAGLIAKTPAFWLIGITMGLLFMSQTGVLANLAAHAQGQGLSGSEAKNLIVLLAATGFVGKLIFGYAADRINLKLGLWLSIGLVAAGLALLSVATSYSLMLMAAACLGLATGGMLPVWGAMIATVFGTVSYGRVMGLMMPVIALSVTPGPILAAKLFDLSGSYTSSFHLFIAVLALAALLLLPLKLLSVSDRQQ